MDNSKNNISSSSFIHEKTIIEAPISCGNFTEVHIHCKIGKFSFINNYSILYPNVSVGRFCSIARNVEIGVAMHPTDFLSTHLFQFEKNMFPNHIDYASIQHVKKSKWFHEPTKIENDVWIGAKATILPGIIIGNGAIVASNSVVTKDVPPYAIVGGVPAKIIKYRFPNDIIVRLLKISWWDLDIKMLQNINFSDINIAINQLEEKINGG